MAVTISQLISTCPANVADATGVTTALTWLATCATFAETQEVSQMPNKSMVKSYGYAYWEALQFKTTEYDDVNNKVQHIKYLLSADNTILSS